MEGRLRWEGKGNIYSGLDNTLTHLTSAFIARIHPTANIRFDLPWTFGPFLTQVPCRLGYYQALDTAADTLVASCTAFFLDGHNEPTAQVLTKYSRALASLRHALDDPCQVNVPETLCAVMILTVVQVLTKSHCFDNDQVLRHLQVLIDKGHIVNACHTVGAAKLLMWRGHFRPKDDFESIIFRRLVRPMVCNNRSS